VKPSRAALHRLIGADTRITVAMAELMVCADVYRSDVDAIQISDIEEIIGRLSKHLETIRARTSAMFLEMYPQQPGAE
jgi:hypothetical protein